MGDVAEGAAIFRFFSTCQVGFGPRDVRRRVQTVWPPDDQSKTVTPRASQSNGAGGITGLTRVHARGEWCESVRMARSNHTRHAGGDADLVVSLAFAELDSIVLPLMAPMLCSPGAGKVSAWSQTHADGAQTSDHRAIECGRRAGSPGRARWSSLLNSMAPADPSPPKTPFGKGRSRQVHFALPHPHARSLHAGWASGAERGGPCRPRARNNRYPH